jgi:hypothetical protein
MPRSAIIPGTPRDPTGCDRLERSALRECDRRFAAIKRAYKAAVAALPAQPVTINARYTFQIDQYTIQNLLDNLNNYVDEILLDGGERNGWMFERYVSVATQRGTAQAVGNLANQSAAYRAARGDLATVLRSEPYLRRIALTRARVFEEMKGLSATTKTDLSRALTEGIGRGLNPRDIAKNIAARTDIGAARAGTIARTEITTALRRARWDESELAEETFGLVTREMHLSALSPTTRPTHAARHSKLYTSEEVRDWWAKDGNSINCKCSTTAVMVDESGKPLVPAIVERAKATKRKMEQSSPGEWAA